MPAGVNFCYFVVPKSGDNYFADAKHFCEVESYVHGGVLTEQEQMDGHKIVTYDHLDQYPVVYPKLRNLEGQGYNTKYINLIDLDFSSLVEDTILFVNKGMFEADKYYGLEEIKEKLEELKETHKIAAYFHFIY